MVIDFKIPLIWLLGGLGTTMVGLFWIGWAMSSQTEKLGQLVATTQEVRQELKAASETGQKLLMIQTNQELKLQILDNRVSSLEQRIK